MIGGLFILAVCIGAWFVFSALIQRIANFSEGMGQHQHGEAPPVSEASFHIRGDT